MCKKGHFAKTYCNQLYLLIKEVSTQAGICPSYFTEIYCLYGQEAPALPVSTPKKHNPKKKEIPT